jgi:hypothetical protein
LRVKAALPFGNAAFFVPTKLPTNKYLHHQGVNNVSFLAQDKT